MIGGGTGFPREIKKEDTCTDKLKNLFKWIPCAGLALAKDYEQESKIYTIYQVICMIIALYLIWK